MVVKYPLDDKCEIDCIDPAAPHLSEVEAYIEVC